MKWIDRKSIFIIISLFFVSNSSAGWTARDLPCKNAYDKVLAQANPTAISVDICKSRCEALPAVYRSNVGLEPAYQYCLSKSGGATDSAAPVTCSQAVQNIYACKSDCRNDYDVCLSSCRSLPTAMERTEAFRKCEANFKGKPLSPAGVEQPVDPSSEEPIAEDPSGEPVPVDPTSENANVIGQNSPTNTNPSGGIDKSALDAVSTDLNNNASAIDFTSGPGAEQGGYANVASGVSGADGLLGSAGQASGTDSNFTGEEMVHQALNPNGNGAGGAAGGPGAGGMPLGGGGGAGGSAANPKRPPNSGGTYRNAANDYLSRHSPFSYQSPGGAAAAGAGGKGNRSVANKKNVPNVKYTRKENDGKDALKRLFGNGLAPSSYRRNPYGAGSGYQCLDTVFCSMESFYNRIKQTPNHDINPDSF